MTLFPKKRPWIILVIIYAVIIGVWVTFIILAGKRDTRQFNPQEADEFYQQHKKPTAEKTGTDTTPQ